MPVPSSNLEIFIESGNESRSYRVFKFSSNASYALEWFHIWIFDASELVDC